MYYLKYGKSGIYVEEKIPTQYLKCASSAEIVFSIPEVRKNCHVSEMRKECPQLLNSNESEMREKCFVH